LDDKESVHIIFVTIFTHSK